MKTRISTTLTGSAQLHQVVPPEGGALESHEWVVEDCIFSQQAVRRQPPVRLIWRLVQVRPVAIESIRRVRIISLARQHVVEDCICSQ